MHTPAHWVIPTDILNVPSIDIDELESMIAGQSAVSQQKPGARLATSAKSERHDARSRR